MVIDSNDVVTRLKCFAYEATEEDCSLIEYIILQVEERVLNSCNLTVFPETLKKAGANEVAGEFLRLKFITGGLPNVEPILKSIREGDATVTYADGSTPQAQLLQLAKSMKISNGDLARHRVIAW